VTRQLVLFMPLLAAACRPSPPASPRGAKPEIDLVREWVDPAAGLEEGGRVAAQRARKPRPTPAPLVIRHATILTAAGRRIDDGTVIVEGTRISAVGDASLPSPGGAVEIDGTGRWVTPGIIDVHSHMGVGPVPDVRGHEDVNEWSSLFTPDAAAGFAYWPQDPSIPRAVAGGVTVAQILPGSANIVGGRGVIVELRPGDGIDDVRFPDGPPTLKMACGENPIRSYKDKGGPASRMGEYAALRAKLRQARDYAQAWKVYRTRRAEWEKRRARAAELGGRIAGEDAPALPARDPGLEVLAGLLAGDVLPQVHCYRASDIGQMIQIAEEFGFRIRAFHHALEAYKVRDVIVAHGAGIATWADWWGFKIEAFDGIPENAALFFEQGGRPIIHSDSPVSGQRLNQDAAKAMAAGRAAGIAVSDDEALRWITANAAWALGIDDVTGTLEQGKRGDLVVWSGNPFSVYTRADVVVIAGDVVYDRSKGRTPTDFELGNSALPAPAPAARGTEEVTP
jgi:imidazolonepropionase-like amidohydrolase